MIRKVAIAIGVLVLLVGVGWRLVPSPASAEDCTFEPGPRVTFKGNNLKFIFEGRQTGDLLYEVRGRLFGMFADDDGCGLSAEVLLEPPVEPGSFPIEGEAELTTSGWSFRPTAANHPMIKSAAVHTGHSFAGPTFPRLAVSGTLTIERVTAKEVTGRLKLRGDGRGGGRMSSPFSARPCPAGKSLECFGE